MSFVLAATASAQLGTPLVPPKLMNHNGATDASLDNGLTLATRASTGTLAGFSSNDPALGAGTDPDIYFQLSRDKGASWTPPAPVPVSFIADPSAIDIEPSVAARQGSFMMVWASTDHSPNGTYDIFSCRGNSDGSSWVNPWAVGFTLGADTLNDRLPCVASVGNTSVVAWQRNHVGAETDIWFARTIGSGGAGSWSTPAPLQSDAATDDGRDLHVKLATDTLGVWIAVWTSTDTLRGTTGDDSDIHYSRSIDDGITWSPVLPLNTTAFSDPNASDYRPAIAVDVASGTWIVSWAAENALGGANGSDADLLWAKSTDAGATWSAPAVLNTNAATDGANDIDDNASITADQLGRFVCVWDRSIGSGDKDVVGARSDDLGLTWTAPELVNTNAASDTGADTLPRIVADGLGTFVAAWNSTESLNGAIGTDGDLLSTRFMTPTSSISPNTTRFCFGFTEAGNPNPCPCGNAAAVSSSGCNNSSGQGASVTPFGPTSVSMTTLPIQGGGLTPGGAVLMFQGTAQFNFGIGIPFGDGLLCIGGTISRLNVGFANGAGQVLVNTVPTNVTSGAVRYYQGWYRDTGAVCGGGLFNLTSAVAATWVP